MKKIPKKEIAIAVLTVIPILVTLFFYPSLPDKIPMHWNIRGEIDRIGGRESALLIPLMLVGFNFLFLLLPKIDPNRENYKKFKGSYDTFRIAFVLFMYVMQGVVLYSAFNPTSVRVEMIVPALIGVLFAVLGNLMPKFKHNYFVGIRTPWTLANEEVWRRTHRLGGVIWFFGGIILVLCAFLPFKIVSYFMFISILLMAFVPIVYSYFVFREVRNRDQRQ